MVTMETLRDALRAQMSRATRRGLLDVLINSAELNRSLGRNPDSKQMLQLCCDAMQAEISHGDVLLIARVNDAGMTVRYRLPRTDQ